MECYDLFILFRASKVEVVEKVEEMLGDVEPKQIHEMTRKTKLERQIRRIAP